MSSDAPAAGCSSVEGNQSWYGGMDGLYMVYVIATCETKSLRACQTVEDSIHVGHVYFLASYFLASYKLTPRPDQACGS